ncbi:hypothetical protein [Parafrankia sp. EUN1f]|uniref:hypothetical protein n=1 Tax=Parafrankia sp. EUN1f TaxID=102897 RepID=UPI0001C45DF2|nr:hypothetical protein [Parafrankia sp. EUN1f]EFC84297.1 hypothetical protein FrEUN1fDRAFT_2597 [Parafrankia sp. EUN1f]
MPTPVTSGPAGSESGHIQVAVTSGPAIILRVDPGSRPWVGPTVLAGATDVAGHITTHAVRFARLCGTALVNGAAGVLAASAEGVFAVAGFMVTGGRIVEIDLLLDPGRLAALHIATGP